MDSSNWLFYGVFLIPLLVGAIFVWGVRRVMRAQAAQAKAAPLSESRGGSRIFERIFFSVFALIGTGLLIPFLILPLWRVQAARNWVAVPCVIETSEVESHRDSDGTTYRPHIAYTYRFEGTEYRSDRYDFMGGSSSGRAGKQAVVDRYPPGSSAQCWVNPGNPNEAVLERGFAGEMLAGAIPLVFAAVGVAGLVYTFRKRQPTEARPGMAGATAGASDDEARVLRPAQSRLGRLLGALAVSAFWNGISWTIFVSAWRDREWVAVAFLSLFVLIGAGLLLATGYAFLTLFNPQPVCTLRPGRLRHGAAPALSWRLTGAVSRLRRLTIALVGREVATYTRGTDRVTERSEFARAVLFDTESPSGFREGELAISLSPDAPPGFAGDHNRIEWALRVQGVIAFWPDLDEEFPVELAGQVGPGAGVSAELPRGDAMIRSPDGALALGTEGGRLAFLPGETLTGAAGWSLPEAPRSAEIRLFWHTKGKGTRDVRVVATVPLDQPGASEVRPFTIALPTEPWSTDGRLVSLVWTLELVLEPGGRNVHRELVISPTGQTVPLPAPFPESPARTGWRRWLETKR